MIGDMLRPRAERQFDTGRSERELGAHKRNYRLPLVLGLFGAILLVIVFGIEPTFWGWWGTTSPGKYIEPQPAFDVAALEDFRHAPIPEPEPKIVQVPVERKVPVPRDIPVIRETQTPAPPRVKEEKFEIEKVRLSGAIGWTPEGEQPKPRMVDGTAPLEAWGCAIRPGLNLIFATLNGDVRWDYGGPIEATVSEPVESPEALARGEHRILIPEGAILRGFGDPTNLRRGMDLAPPPVWTEIAFVDTMGNPQSINLADAAGAGAGGINGIGGKVDARWGQIIGMMLFDTFLQALSSVNVNFNVGDSSDEVTSTGVRIGGSPAASIGREVIRGMLDIKPRVLSRKGQAIIVKPLQPIKVC